MRFNNQLIFAFGLIVLGYISTKIAAQAVKTQQKARKLNRKKELQTWEGEGGNVMSSTPPSAS
jgi:hypothetical protein